MKKIFSILVITIFFVTVMVNCGGDAKKAMDSATETVSDAANTAKEAVGSAAETVKEGVEKVTHKADIANGEKVYKKVCVACHMTGVAGAAALNDKKRWEENAALGMDALVKIAIKGNPKGKYGVMPERGTCSDCSDDDLADAVAYMLKEAGVTAK